MERMERTNSVENPFLRNVQDTLRLRWQPGNLKARKTLQFVYDVGRDGYTPFFIQDLSVGTIVSQNKWSVLVAWNSPTNGYVVGDFLISVDVSGQNLGQGANFVAHRWKAFQSATAVGDFHVPQEKLIIPPGCTQQGSVGFAGLGGVAAIAESFGLALSLC